MKTIIAGSRGLDSLELIEEAIADSSFVITEVVSGNARGVDKTGELWADRHKIPKKIMPADWKRKPDGSYDKAAGYKRNVDMAEYAEALVAVWDGVSKGTNHMITIAVAKGLAVFVYNTRTKQKFWFNDPLNQTGD